MLYFDHNATSPLCPAAREAWLQATTEFIGNPSSPHRLGSRAEHAIERAREDLAGYLGCAAHDIVWTSGATEAVNAALHHLARATEGEAWVSALEHPCVLQAARRWFGPRVGLIPALATGVVDLQWLAERLARERPAVVAVMAANNETGALQPWREVLELCRVRQVPMLCDAAQWIGKLAASGLGQADFVAGCAHKFGGPAGVGFLKVPRGFSPLLVGGEQEEGRRAGTENVAGILSMLAALRQREAFLAKSDDGQRRQWRDEFEQALESELRTTQVLQREQVAIWNTVSVIMPETDKRWVVKLDRLGLAVSTGSACASGREQPSHVLSAMGLSPALASRVLRFSSGWETTREDWQSLLDGLRQAITGGI